MGNKKLSRRGAFNTVAIMVLAVIMVITLFYVVSINNKLSGMNGNMVTGAAVKDSQEAEEKTAPTNQNNEELANTGEETIKGDPNAPIEIIEYSDFECPFCARFYSETLPEIQEKYIDTGKVKLIYKDFPLGFHRNAQKAGEAAECAKEQGKFWEMHDTLYETKQLNVADLKQHAVDLGLDSEQFNKCLETGKYESEVKEDFNEGAAAGVKGTPSFVINGELLVGAQPFSAFEKVIEAQLGE